MNFLDLCRRARQETGISNTGPSNVTGQTGDLLRIVDWVNQSWLRLQALRTDWAWMWRTGALALTAGSNSYALPAAVKTLVNTRLYLTDGSRESELTFIPYAEFTRRHRSVGAGRPSVVTIRPDGQLLVAPSPDQSYTLNYEYFAAPALFADGISAPTLDDEHHMIIVWGAVMAYALFDEAPELYQQAKINYEAILFALERETLPPLEIAGAVA